MSSTWDTRFRIRRGTAAALEAHNIVLEDGEPEYEKDTHRLKIGDGVTKRNDLPYVVSDISGDPGGVDPTDLLAHINSLTPHPVYDDIPSLVLIYENAKV